MAGREPADDTPLTLAHVRPGDGAQTLAQALAFVRSAALALDRFHARQPVHGSLSPEAFVRGGDGRLTVVAPAPHGSRTADDRTFWSPQRRAGQPPRPADDLYALGLIAERLLHAADRDVGAPGPDIGAARSAADALVRALTSWSPSERPASGAEVVRALDRIALPPDARASAGPPASLTAAGLPLEPPWAAAERVSQARRAHQLAQAAPPPVEPRRPAQVRAPLGRGLYPDMPLPLPWVAAIVVVLCSVYLLPLYFMLFPAG